MPDRGSRYSFYITINSNRTVLYCGVTNKVEERLMERFLGKERHYEHSNVRVRCTMWN